MSLVHILVFWVAAALYRLLARGRTREWLLLVASVTALYWLQPATPIRHLDFWLPAASLLLVILTWAATRPRQPTGWREPAVTFGVTAAVVLALSLPRVFDFGWSITATRPPAIGLVVVVLLVMAAGLLGCAALAGRRLLLIGGAALLVGLFVIVKTQPLATDASALIRSWTGQSPDLANALDIRWLGFSYLAFRLLHALRDRLAGRLPGLTLREFLVYALFFPALTAGPIDRAERFTSDLRAPVSDPVVATQATWRVLIGVFKKYVLADSLALVALNAPNATQTSSTFWSWILLYAFALQLYLDFSGYTDVAIGLGLLMGIRLPENFVRPYLQPNLTAFWNSWHITLASWFRAYFFNPLARSLRQSRTRLPAWFIILVSQLSTMVLIGLWHGVTANFALWGAWHGLGLFVHNRWTDLIRRRRWDQRWGAGPVGRVLPIASALLTFHFVTLGWVWFALPNPGLSWSVLLRLFGR